MQAWNYLYVFLIMASKPAIPPFLNWMITDPAARLPSRKSHINPNNSFGISICSPSGATTINWWAFGWNETTVGILPPFSKSGIPRAQPIRIGTDCGTTFQTWPCITCKDWWNPLRDKACKSYREQRSSYCPELSHTVFEKWVIFNNFPAFVNFWVIDD